MVMKYTLIKQAENYLSLEGSTTGSNLNYKLQKPNLGAQIRIAEAYGTEAGVGGSVEYYTGSIDLINQQVYDLNDFATSQSLTQEI